MTPKVVLLLPALAVFVVLSDAQGEGRVVHILSLKNVLFNLEFLARQSPVDVNGNEICFSCMSENIFSALFEQSM